MLKRLRIRTFDGGDRGGQRTRGRRRRKKIRQRRWGKAADIRGRERRRRRRREGEEKPAASFSFCTNRPPIMERLRAVAQHRLEKWRRIQLFAAPYSSSLKPSCLAAEPSATPPFIYLSSLRYTTGIASLRAPSRPPLWNVC
ncbi:hypothetical protein E2C01_013209 [Portunus trituberculatus]|uniref:Uncharacterized protein n=1 Tax=Portunus trituberculatus TaxID=210409 RepID=A0A5B7DGB6_PORTR|nr:hypothetical protein [Portunus trituberculatus]